jgi:hypothetical protein
VSSHSPVCPCCAGEPCQQFAVWGDEAGRCAAHGGRVPGPHRAEKTAYTTCTCGGVPLPAPAGGWPVSMAQRAPVPCQYAAWDALRRHGRTQEDTPVDARQPTILFFHWRL